MTSEIETDLPTLKRVIIIGSRGRQSVTDGIEKNLDLIKSYVEVVEVDTEGIKDLSQIDADFVMVFGGDGTMLSIPHKLKQKSIPVIGINLGNLGFLTEATLDELEEVLQRIADKNFILNSRSILQCRICLPSGKVFEDIAVNELALRRANSSRIFAVDLMLDNTTVTQFAGDGLIVATPTGSTGYSLSANGPILEAKLDAFLVNPVCPHRLSHRPLVIDTSRTIILKPYIERQQVIASIDGQVATNIEQGSYLEIRKADKDFKLIELSLHSQYEKLRAKLGWGS